MSLNAVGRGLVISQCSLLPIALSSIALGTSLRYIYQFCIMTPSTPMCYQKVLKQCHVEPPPLVGHCPPVFIPVEPIAHMGCSSRDPIDVGIVNVHAAPIRNIAIHWNLCYKDTSSLCIQRVEKILSKRGGNKFRLLCKREIYWIFHLNTRKPIGMNFEWDISHFYE